MKTQIIFFLLLSQIALAQQNPCFVLSPHTAGCWTSPSVIRTGDFNNDGLLDVAAIASMGYQGSYQLGINFGDLVNGPSKDTLIMTPSAVFALGTADFNHDSLTDVVLTGFGVAYVNLSSGSGNFHPPIYFPAFFYPTAVATGDFDKDGNADFAVADSSLGKIIAVSGTGYGNFSFMKHIPVAKGLVSLVAKDLNADGRLDLVTSNGSATFILKGEANGEFTLINTINIGFWAFGHASPSEAFECVDLNNDKHVDIIGINKTSGIIFLKGNGNFSFTQQLATSNSSTSFPYYNTITCGDYNVDGKQDFIVGTWNDIKLYLNNGNFTFNSPITVPVPGFPYANPVSLTTADFNNDQKDDILTSPDNFTSLMFLLNCNTLGMNEGISTENTLSIFPNPANENFTVRKSDVKKDARLYIYNQAGALVLEQILSSTQTVIEPVDLREGLYTVRLTQDHEPDSFAKLIIDHH